MTRIQAGPKATDHRMALDGKPATNQELAAVAAIRAAQSERARSRRRIAPRTRAARPPAIGVTAAPRASEGCAESRNAVSGDTSGATPVCSNGSLNGIVSLPRLAERQAANVTEGEAVLRGPEASAARLPG